jgi:hypothetical protein
MVASLARCTCSSAFFHAFFSSAESSRTCVLPVALTLASASSFSCLAMSFAYCVASFIAPSSVERILAGRPSQNFLLTMTAYSTTPWLESVTYFCTSFIFCVYRLDGGFSVPSTTPVCSAW